ncbi:sulfatase [Prolixibacteraceae bacterium Z1-6]|uniref:Sulfatase n=1 Tax=Draconibacterium aestuarii TaxID=2998507 RepID=A0A9X3J799_9BACT|nr:sulfatase [Prolixibacteraceae bacterium Z1-6]
MNRITIAIVITSALITGCTTVSTEKPNVVLILADDLGYNQVGCYGTNYYKTPNIDKLAADGIRFTDAYAACLVCSPTRASIMTGKYPGRLHLTDFIPGNTLKNPLKEPDWQKFLPLAEMTIGELAKEAGYATAAFGKWHLSIEKKAPASLPYNPDKQGFDESFVTFKPGVDKTRRWQNAESDAHNVDTITTLAMDFIERKKGEPFLLYIAHNTIHDPLAEKEKTIAKYIPGSEKPENNAIIGAMIERLDQSVKKIIDKIDEAGISDNTIVLFFSDNGGLAKYAKQTPLRAGKGFIYEGGIREPLIVKWPAKIKAETTSKALISSVDFFPTFAEIMGLDTKAINIDGKSFLNNLLGQSDQNHDAIFWHYPHYHSTGMTPSSAVRMGDYKLIKWYEKNLLHGHPGLEMFNLKEDIGETKNIAEEYPEKTNELEKLLEKWLDDTNAQRPTIWKN